MCRLGTAGLRRILETSKNEADMPLAVMSSMAQRVPYLGVYLDADVTQSTEVDVTTLSASKEEEVPVSWCTSGFFGALAKGGTEPEYRRRGFADLLRSTVARVQASHLGFTPHAFVSKGNSVSYSTFLRRAFWQQTHQAFWLCTSNVV